MDVIGIDIGGANLKAASTRGARATLSFPLWREPQELNQHLRQLLDPLGPADQIAVTMTAELADCFTTKAEGVRFILDALAEVAAPTPLHVWQTGAEFVSPEVATEIPLLVAAANWHALATWLGRIVPHGPALLIDVGTTTTDIIPLRDGRPVPVGLTDCERLQAGELLYTGVRRSPLCALAHSVPLRDGHCSLAAELFATTLDLHLLLDLIPQDELDRDTANGRPATKADAQDRLARMLCCDRTELSAEELLQIATFLHNVQKQRIRGCIDRVHRRLRTEDSELPHVIVSGSGEFLARQIISEHERLRSAERTELSRIYDDDTAAVACAMAVAQLAAEM